MTMIERVARAIARAHADPQGQMPTDTALEVYGYIGMARAAIAAMREPTQLMIVATDLSDDPLDAQRLDSIEWWQAMIDTALEEK